MSKEGGGWPARWPQRGGQVSARPPPRTPAPPAVLDREHLRALADGAAQLPCQLHRQLLRAADEADALRRPGQRVEVAADSLDRAEQVEQRDLGGVLAVHAPDAEAGERARL